MNFKLDINKSLAATAYLMQKAGGSFDVFCLLKTLYLADRTALVQFGRTITGDNFCSMDNGPVPSRIYDFIKGKGDTKLLAEWRKHFTDRENHKIHIKSEPEMGYLSQREREVLDVAFERISVVPPYRLAQWTHDNFPEWQDPHGSSIPIDPNGILRKEGKSEEEIFEIEDEISALNFVRTVVG